ncbi:MAG: hypothetical protein E7B11_26940 [Clostridiales bacterium]|nr:hypothetical protein [Clostridiales bacterium]
MEAAQMKSEKKEGIYVGIHHLNKPGPCKLIERIDLKKLPDNVLVIGQLGRENGIFYESVAYKKSFGNGERI